MSARQTEGKHKLGQQRRPDGKTVYLSRQRPQAGFAQSWTDSRVVKDAVLPDRRRRPTTVLNAQTLERALPTATPLQLAIYADVFGASMSKMLTLQDRLSREPTAPLGRYFSKHDYSKRFSVLDAPGIVDDYYTHCMETNAMGDLLLGLDSSVIYRRCNKTGKITELVPNSLWQAKSQDVAVRGILCIAPALASAPERVWATCNTDGKMAMCGTGVIRPGCDTLQDFTIGAFEDCAEQDCMQSVVMDAQHDATGGGVAWAVIRRAGELARIDIRDSNMKETSHVDPLPVRNALTIAAHPSRPWLAIGFNRNQVLVVDKRKVGGRSPDDCVMTKLETKAAVNCVAWDPWSEMADYLHVGTGLGDTRLLMWNVTRDPSRADCIKTSVVTHHQVAGLICHEPSGTIVTTTGWFQKDIPPCLPSSGSAAATAATAAAAARSPFPEMRSNEHKRARDGLLIRSRPISVRQPLQSNGINWSSGPMDPTAEKGPSRAASMCLWSLRMGQHGREYHLDDMFYIPKHMPGVSDEDSEVRPRALCPCVLPQSFRSAGARSNYADDDTVGSKMTHHVAAAIPRDHLIVVAGVHLPENRPVRDKHQDLAWLPIEDSHVDEKKMHLLSDSEFQSTLDSLTEYWLQSKDALTDSSDALYDPEHPEHPGLPLLDIDGDIVMS